MLEQYPDRQAIHSSFLTALMSFRVASPIDSYRLQTIPSFGTNYGDSSVCPCEVFSELRTDDLY